MNVFSRINQAIFPGSKEYPKVGAGKLMLLGLQHAFAMSCATILVPLLTGMDVGVALFAAGLGTIIFAPADVCRPFWEAPLPLLRRCRR